MVATTRTRAVLSGTTVPGIPPYVRLLFDKVREQWAVLAPEKVMWPDEISIEILKKCDGAASIDAISNALASEYDAPLAEVAADVLEFLQEWSDRRLIVVLGPAEAQA
ncbi:pyrroloquinoline quinone biosynthesis peptide chaperone PqqD [Roseibium sediminis]|uniref:pyrroloquinoline quinone biosynthesis peptide chaperone PqqD n=1 Tax=Roseibium sediminis TaxID=1775174 RepID=UPI001AD8EC4A|nr:pyrroloquinoline quinone biosynthesis peptide chaperone PqqD [Roseibium sediminis]